MKKEKFVLYIFIKMTDLSKNKDDNSIFLFSDNTKNSEIKELNEQMDVDIVNDYDEIDEEEEEEEEEEKKHSRKTYIKNDEKIHSIISEIMNDMETDEDLSTQIHNYMQEINWSGDLTPEDIKVYKPIYDKICENISVMPKISDILKLSIPYEEKCDIIEKILILNNAEPNTFEFLQLKRHLNKMIDKYKNFTLTSDDYEKYKNIEEKLTFDEKKYKPIKYQILDLDISDSNKAFLYQRWKYFSTLDANNSEYNKLKQWIDSVMGLPTQTLPMMISNNDTSYKINKYLWSVKNMLDQEIFGLDAVKEKILFILNNRITNNKSKGLSFALCGPPGTAKTSIIKCLSKAISLPFFQINIGGAKDSSYLVGHSYTYEGAVPGVIVQALTALKYKNGILYFDEFDKISNSLHGVEISRMLLHITDFTQNDKFHDRYISNGIDIDLSHIWFIYSLNDKSLLDKTLLDRIPIITVDGYDKKEKYKITKDYLIPKALDNINLKKDRVIFSDEAIKYIIDISEKENPSEKSGVRQIKHLIDNLLMKINLLRTTYKQQEKGKFNLNLSFQVPGFKLPITITKNLIDQLKIRPDNNDDISYRNMYI